MLNNINTQFAVNMFNSFSHMCLGHFVVGTVYKCRLCCFEGPLSEKLN